MTDKEKLESIKAEIKRYKHKADERLKIKGRTISEDCKDSALQNLCGNLLHFIDSLPEEPVSEDNTLRKASEEYLKVLSETPYNNTPITNAQTIVRELITFLDNPSKYNPNHIEEIVSEDLEEAAWMYYDKNKPMLPPEFALHRVFVDFFKAGAQWQIEKVINKACEYLWRNNFSDKWIENFLKALNKMD